MSRDLTRRSLIAAAAFAALPGRAQAIGLPVGPDLVEAFESVPGIVEGRGKATLHILFAPWCHVSPILYRETRGILDSLTLRWIPTSGGQPEGREATEILLRNMDPALVPSAFSDLRSQAGAMETPLSDRQDSMIAVRIGPLIARDTSRPLGSPTLAYRFRDGRARVVPGGLSLAQLSQIAELGA